MTSTLKNKKGVVLTELIASTIMMGLIGTMLAGIMLFTFKSYEITVKNKTQSQAALFITQSIANEISTWGAENVDVANCSETKIVLKRYKYFYDDANGTTVRVRLTEDMADSLIIELITAGSETGNIKVSFVALDNMARNYEKIIDLDNYKVDLSATKFSVSTMNTVTAEGITVALSYSVDISITTEKPYVLEIPIRIPVIVKGPEI